MNDDRHNVTWLLACLLLVLSVALGAKHRNDVARWLRPDSAPIAVSRALEPARAAAVEPLRVLFIGNSLTATNDIPAMVARLAAAAKQARAFEYQSDTPGGFGFTEHAVTGRIPQHLQHAHWDTVVLQDQGQRPGWWPSEREAKVNAPARVIDRAIRAAGSKTLFYLTYARREGDFSNYPSDTYDAMQGRLVEGYTQIARELNAAVVPVGVIWQAVHHEHPALRLWVQDGLHPSIAGSYLAACTFYAYFYRDSPIGNAYLADLDPADARAIQQGVAEVMLGWRQAGELRSSDTAMRPSAAEPQRPAQASDEAAEPGAPGLAGQRGAEAEQDRGRHAQIEADRKQRALHAARARIPVKLYSAPWCGYCRMASAYMREAGIAFDEYDIDHDAAAKTSVQRLNPRGSVPTIDIDGEVLIGWSAQRFEDTFDRAAKSHMRL